MCSRVKTARPHSRTKILQIGTADDLEGQVEVLSIRRDLQSIRNDVDKPVVTPDIVRRVTGKPENRPTHLGPLEVANSGCDGWLQQPYGYVGCTHHGGPCKGAIMNGYSG